MSLRLKLLLIGLVVLVLPWAAWRFVGTTERLLRQGEEQALLAATETLARAVQTDGLVPAPGHGPALYAWRLEGALWLDGYGDEWRDWRGAFRTYTPAGADGTDPFEVRFGLAHDDSAYYLLFQVQDRDIVYPRSPDPETERGDHIRLRLHGPDGERVLVVDTMAPGRIQARSEDGDPSDTFVGGEWQETSDGYSVELRVPRTAASHGMGFAVADVDGGGEPVWAGTGDPPPAEVLRIVTPRPGAQERLTDLVSGETRVWLVDSAGRVLARTDTALADAGGGGGRWLRNLLYRHVLASPLQPAAERGPHTVRIREGEVMTALDGHPATAWRASRETSGVVVSAVQPVRGPDGAVLGAVLAERASEGVLLLTERAMIQLLGTILLAVGVALGALMLFAARLSGRIRQLRDTAATAVDTRGLVSTALPERSSRDELGDLSRSFARTLEALGEYNRYLRSLAGRLSHELRTPLAMVSSSLENLGQGELDERARLYAGRARQGADRLSRILRAMSEATRVEQAVRSEEPEPFELDALLRSFVDGYRDLHPERVFGLEIAEADYRMTGAPELVGQMLDKLVDNAVGFTPEGGWIRIGLRRPHRHAELTVANQGPPLPERMQDRLFDSLVSLRERTDHPDGSPHLGLGLYVARLVAEMHGGGVHASNLADGTGVVFTVRLGGIPSAPRHEEG